MTSIQFAIIVYPALMFAVMIFAIYCDVKRRRAAEAAAREALLCEEAEAEAEAEAEQRRILEWEISEWHRDMDAFERGESPRHPGPTPRVWANFL
jgi:hypothetical protein